MIPVVISTEIFLLYPNSSIIKATGTSTIDSIAVVAAIEVKRKKAINKIFPKGILEKTSGIVLKSNPGPDPGSSPKVNTTGNMAIPANKDTIVSENAT